MVTKNETTNSEKKPIINNDEALRLIDLIQQGDSNAENELREQLLEFLQNNEELWSDAHVKDFYTFATTLAKEWLASHQS